MIVGDLDRRVVVGVSIALLSVIIIIIYRGARSVRPGIADAIVQHPEHGSNGSRRNRCLSGNISNPTAVYSRTDGRIPVRRKGIEMR